MAQKRNALGRGLDALLSMDDIQTGGSSSINEIELSKISVNPNQPRREFDSTALQELADSIAEIGVIQPITLRQISDDEYQIIAGERRFRASQMAGLTSIPAYIRTADDENMMEMALIENIQREDLNSVEIALAYQHLLDQYGLTQERLSERVGKKRTTIANYLRLLKLPAPVQMGLQNKQIDMGHARALVALDNPKLQMKVYEEILEHGYSVRKVEEIVKSLSEGEAIKSGKYDVIILNYANCDMVGHTGVFEAAVKAVEAVENPRSEPTGFSKGRRPRPDWRLTTFQLIHRPYYYDY